MNFAKFIIVTVLGCCSLLPAAAQTYRPGSAEDTARKEAMTDYLGEGEIVNFIDGSKMVGADYFTVLVEGEGPDVVLIPGLSTPRAMWDRTREQLKGRFKVHTVQTRGFGDKGPRETLTPEDRSLFDTYSFHLADYIDDYVIRIGKGQNPKIIGHSVGGLTAMQIAINMGHQVDRVMVIDSLPFYGPMIGPDMTIEKMKPYAVKLRTLMAADQTGEAYSGNVAPSMSRTEAGVAQVQKWANSADTNVAAHFMHDILTTDIRPHLNRLAVPLTVLYSHDASIMSEADADKMYQGSFVKANTAKFVRINDSRHFIMLDQPEKFAEAVEEFLTGHGLDRK